MGRTMFDLPEREVTPTVLNNVGLNFAALMILVKSYGANVSPLPASLAFHLKKGGDITTVEVYLSTPGYLGKAKSIPENALDKFGLKLLADSYLGALSPRPVSFRFMNCLVDIRTKGIPEDLYPNVLRDIYNPTK